MGQRTAEVERIVSHLVEALKQRGVRVERVILFGSEAAGTAKPDSDIDLLVISPDFGRRILADYETVYACLPLDRDIAVDVIPKHPRQVETTLQDSVVATAVRHGVEVYRAE